LRVADPKKYSDEAERVRREAAETSQVDIQRTMLDIAKLYDRLSETLARQRQGPKTS
jgi:hypothetical protein